MDAGEQLSAIVLARKSVLMEIAVNQSVLANNAAMMVAVAYVDLALRMRNAKMENVSSKNRFAKINVIMWGKKNVMMKKRK